MKLLIVDDEPMIVRGLCKLLDYSGLGFSAVLTASTGEDALALLQTQAPEIMLSDVAMPGLTGLDLLKTVKELKLNTFVVFLSGYPNFTYAQEALKLGAVDYLLKPVEQDKLTAALQRAVERWQQTNESAVLEKRLQSFDGDHLASSKWLKTQSEDDQAQTNYLLMCMQAASQPEESAMAASIRRFAAFNKADSLATQKGCVCFVKDEHLVIIVQGEKLEEQGLQIQSSIQETLNVPVRFASSGVLAGTQDIPQAHRRCAAYLEAAAPTVETEEPMIEKVKKVIALHYAQPLSLETMAQVACVTTAYFSSYFRKQTGVGFKDYLTHTRIEAAKKLLATTDLKVYEVAARVGFSDARYFSETFKAQTKLLPQQYREKH